MTERLSNTYNSAMGTVKENLGSAIGSESLAASGSEQRARADVKQKTADAQTHAEGIQNKAKGEIQKNVGSLTDNKSQEAKGHANAALETSNTLYALSYGFVSETPVVILIKSNAAPSSPNALTWSVVSTTPRSNLVNIVTKEIACLADPSGAFTVFASDTSDNRPGGFRYHPNLSQLPGSTGSGGWANITIPKDYAWGFSSSPGRLFYLKDSSGTYNVYQAYTKPSGSNTLRFGALNTGTNSMENTETTWSLSPASGTDSIAITGSHIFVWEYGYPNYRFYTAALPQGSLSSAAAPKLVAGDYVRSGKCSRLPYGTEYQLYAWDGSKALPVVNTTNGLPSEFYSNTQIGTVGDGKNAFMLIQTGMLTQYSSNDYKLSALLVAGSNVGSIEVVSGGVTVPDGNIGYLQTKGSGGGGSGGTSNVWSIIGTVISILVGLTIVYYIVRCFRGKRRSPAPVIPVHKPDPEPEYSPPVQPATLDDQKLQNQTLPTGYAPMMGAYSQNASQMSGAFPISGYPVSGYPNNSGFQNASGVIPATNFSSASGNFPISGVPQESGAVDMMIPQVPRDPLRHLLQQQSDFAPTAASNGGLSGSTLASTPAANSVHSQGAMASHLQSQSSGTNSTHSQGSVSAPRTQATYDKNLASDGPKWYSADNVGPAPGSNSFPLQALSQPGANAAEPMVEPSAQTSAPEQPSASSPPNSSPHIRELTGAHIAPSPPSADPLPPSPEFRPVGGPLQRRGSDVSLLKNSD
ncbi:hypothetical protein BGZ73_001305 [Actinomortierella ambigua]|nr:hypothetical protein BGZ73_001305 [Actinomortierella ambigua]